MTRVSWLHVVMLISPALSFSTNQHPSLTIPRCQPRTFRSPPRQQIPTSTQLDALVELDGATSVMDDFFRTQPFLSAFVACSVKASAADFLAQSSVVPSNHHASEVQRMLSHSRQQVDDAMIQLGTINIQRNVAFLLYGGLYQGMFLQFLYLVVYPSLYSESAFRIPLSIFSDIFAFGPFVTLPIAYIIQSVMASITEPSADDNTKGYNEFLFLRVHGALEKYQNHVFTKDLLTKYWMVWGPAQTINWCFVPEHLRVFFVAFVSFFWVYLLSAISSQQAENSQDITAQPSQYIRSQTMRT